MVGEVVAGESKLQLLRFAELEVLEEGKVAVEKRRAEEFRKHDRSLSARDGRDGEATPVEELVRAEVLPGIAGKNRIQRNLVCTVDGKVCDGGVVDILGVKT